MTLNPHDLSEILDRLGYYIDDDTGEVSLELDPCGPPTIDKFLVLLASQGQLTTKRTAAHELGFYLTNWQWLVVLSRQDTGRSLYKIYLPALYSIGKRYLQRS